MRYGLNEEQFSAVLAKSPVFVNATAGSGKTRCLIAKIQYLLDSGVSPDKICAITFTNKAANEMKDRLKPHTDVSKMQISTIHSMCVKIIRTFIGKTPLKIPFSIYDDGDQMSIVKTIVKARELPGHPREYLSLIGKSKSNDIIPVNKPDSEIYSQYQEILRKNNACDFDDLLLFARDCLKDLDCKNYFCNKWCHVLVDECQDTSLIQFNILNLLYDPNVTKTLFAVGDPNQAIFSFRGARPDNIYDFIEKYSATVKYLTYNYRSCAQVINCANNFQQSGKPMQPKSYTSGKVSVTEFDSYEDEAEKIAVALLKMGKYNETAIIYRINSRSLFFEQAFTRYRIPYKLVNETSFFNRRVTRDLLAVLKAANNLKDIESLSRIINVPRRGFGPAKQEQLLLQGRSYVEGLTSIPAIRDFLDLMSRIRGIPPEPALNLFLNESGYRDTLTKESDVYMVSALLDLVVKYDSVEDLILASTFLERDSGTGVNLITAHASKGLEFDRVFVVGVENELWPHKNSSNFKEEERLFYVACTRARHWLNVSYSRSRMYRGNYLPITASGFFKNTFNYLYKGAK